MTTLATVTGLQELLTKYLDQFPEEYIIHYAKPKEGSFRMSLGHFLEMNQTGQLYNRKNFHGHLTASAFIISENAKKILLLQHKSLDRWLQPGGHIDDTDESILAAAYREVEEETGIKPHQLQLISLGSSPTIPFDIDSHVIPANPKKNEDAHVHHDFRFLLQLKAEANITISTLESTSYRWVSVDSLCEIKDHARVANKMSATAF